MTVRAAETRCVFPTKNDWDTFFRDAKNMNEMKPGERPDTIHVKNLPTAWFMDSADSDNLDKPSERILKECYEMFGTVRLTDIPMLDKYR